MASTTRTPSVGILERIFPALTKQCNPSDFFHFFFIYFSFFLWYLWISKHKRNSYPINNTKSTILFMVIHTDLWGPTTAWYRWLMTFIDCYSSVTWIYLLHNKNEVYSCFQSFHKMIETQFDGKIRVRRENVREYIDKNFQEYLTKNGIVSQWHAWIHLSNMALPREEIIF